MRFCVQWRCQPKSDTSKTSGLLLGQSSRCVVCASAICLESPGSANERPIVARLICCQCKFANAIECNAKFRTVFKFDAPTIMWMMIMMIRGHIISGTLITGRNRHIDICSLFSVPAIACRGMLAMLRHYKVNGVCDVALHHKASKQNLSCTYILAGVSNNKYPN